MVKKNIFVILGSDASSKKRQIENIKSRLQKECPGINTVLFFVEDNPFSSLQIELENLSFSARLFIIKSAQSLSLQEKTYLRKVLGRKETRDYFLFDSDLTREALERDSFFSFLFKLTPPFKMAAARKEYSLRDLEVALRENSPARALLVVSSLFGKYRRSKKQGKKEIPLAVLPSYILGVTVKIFSSFRSPHLRKKYLKYIFDTDRLIKEGSLNSRTALEMLVLRLTQEEN